ncbi:MAG: alpha/beta hydrolase fold domain-containing protein [Ilumatobacteraceae bacterium]
MENETITTGPGALPDVDVVVVGAGMAGLYMLHELRSLGMSAVVLETAADVGGTWFWNRYPGARCDVQSIDYQYTFDPELEADWEWSEKYATQPEILRYLQHVADRYDLRRDIRFETRVEAAIWSDDTGRWTITPDAGDPIDCRFFVMGTGCLSVPKAAEIAGAERFGGDVYFTSRWPHDGVDFTGQRVAVIGTGSSAIQSIPLIAAEAEQLTVFQRTPNFSVPAYNGPPDAARAAALAADRDAYRAAARWSGVGVPIEPAQRGAWQATEAERNQSYEEGWAVGGLFGVTRGFNDLLLRPSSNHTAAEFVREKIRQQVDDPETAEALCPKNYPILSKRLCVDTDYYITYNQPHVRLVDLRSTPIDTITETGIDVRHDDGTESIEFDSIVYATGFDAMTGALVSVDVTGRGGVTLARKWADGPETYLGVMTAGFPNFFMITGPGSPSVLSNMAVSIEQHVEWIAACLADLREGGHDVIEPTATAEAGWVQHVNDCANITLFPQANSWYMGANVPGKARVFLPYVGGVDTYRRTCDEVVQRGYLGFRRAGSHGEIVDDGVVNRLQPDVSALLRIMADLALPPIDSMGAPEARGFMEMVGAERPPGPDVGEIVDGTLPGAAGDLDYRLYRPSSQGPHPVVVYFHGGGWVLGNLESDDPFCRDLCDRSGAIVVSVDYRHAPEHPYPAAADDASAAVGWIAAHAIELGGIPGQIVVAGWSAGANIAAVAAQRARDAGGPTIVGQLLVTPVTDGSRSWPSMSDNGDGFVLTKSLMEWFWDHYDADRGAPGASPLLADTLADLPPAAIFTSEFDPLRDEGAAYAAALSAAGVPTHHHSCRGHIHTSLTAVDVIISGAPIRAAMAEHVQKFVAG